MSQESPGVKEEMVSAVSVHPFKTDQINYGWRRNFPRNREQQEVRKMGTMTLAHRNQFLKLLTRQEPLPPHNIVS